MTARTYSWNWQLLDYVASRIGMIMPPSRLCTNKCKNYMWQQSLQCTYNRMCIKYGYNIQSQRFVGSIRRRPNMQHRTVI